MESGVLFIAYDVKSPMSVRNSHMIEVKRAVRRAILRDKFSNFWKK